mmetsp:Transcript_29950/g.34023  ORF Transcript_29950/g.34023 Transcript_29950/m.34023 type:complete len:220 (+) Transcript_29950:148-807(+)
MSDKNSQRVLREISSVNIEVPLCSHDSCIISAFRGLRNGLYYGGRIRFFHSLVMVFMFGGGSFSHKVKQILRATYQHAKNLGLFVFFYKLVVCAQRKLFKSRNNLHSLVAGFLVSYFVFGEKNPVNSQIMMYMLSRDVMAYGRMFADQGILPNWNFFSVLSAICWGLIMFIFEVNGKYLQSSTESSMVFLYKDSDSWESWRDFIPFEMPRILEGCFKRR